MDRKLAQTIVDQIMSRLGKNINMMDRTGTIIASGDPLRIGIVHEGALEVIKSGEAVIIHPQKGQKEYLGTKPGVNLPIKYGGEIQGVVGITGPPKAVMEFGAMVVMMADLLIERSVLQNERESVDRSKGFLLEECLKEDLNIENITFKLKVLQLKLNPPYQLAVFRVRLAKSLYHDPFSAHYQIRERLRELPILYNFVNESDFVILRISQDSTKFFDIIDFITDVFKSHFHHVQVGLPEAFQRLTETRFHFNRTLRAFNLTDNETVVPEAFEAQLLMSEVKKESANWFIERRLKQLPENLVHTLTIFFENHLNMSQTAKQLFIHRNTLIYRLDRVKDLVGLDPRQFKDAVDLQIAIWLYRTKNEGL